MSKSFFPSLRWLSTSAALGAALGATDAKLDELPEHEKKGLQELIESSYEILNMQSKSLPENDKWKFLNEKENEVLRNEILIRFLRFNNLSKEKSINQVKETMKWRSKTMISSLSEDVLFGKQVGLPIVKLAGPNDLGEVLYLSIGEAYIRKEINYPKQEIGASKLFDFILYDINGPNAKYGSIVIDFSNISLENIDLIGIKNGIFIYLNYFPDIFHKILFINYPKLIYGVWKAVHPLLDARTKSRVMWMESGDRLRSTLSKSFDMNKIPTWLGGQSQLDEITLLNGKTYQSSYLSERLK